MKSGNAFTVLGVVDYEKFAALTPADGGIAEVRAFQIVSERNGPIRVPGHPLRPGYVEHDAVGSNRRPATQAMLPSCMQTTGPDSRECPLGRGGSRCVPVIAHRAVEHS